MQLTVHDLDISTGDINVVLLNKEDAHTLDLHSEDRVLVTKNGNKAVAILNIAESKKAVPPGSIGFFEETLAALNAKDGDKVMIHSIPKPQSVSFIKKKLEGKRLLPKELNAIVKDIVDNRLSDVELTSFVISSYTRGMNMKEIAALTRAMADTGQKLSFKQYPVVDLHSIGGVPGNRTTMVVVPILVAAGCIVPKTSSRAITSPSGTADTMEVLCPVSIPINKLKKIIDDVGGFLIWGGAVNLAPADDRIIRIEHPLSIDAEGQMLASIMAKKASVGATHLLMEIPIGKNSKVPNKRAAKHLAHHFAELGHLLNIKVKTIITDGSESIGSGIGPILEAKDVMQVLKCDGCGPQDLAKKSIWLAGVILEFVGKAKKGQGKVIAQRLLKSGAAYGAMCRIIEAQGGKVPNIDDLRPSELVYTYRASRKGTIKSLDNAMVAKVARLAGAPIDAGSGIYIHKHVGDKVARDEPLLTIYAKSNHKLNYAIEALKDMGGIDIR